MTTVGAALALSVLIALNVTLVGLVYGLQKRIELLSAQQAEMEQGLVLVLQRTLSVPVEKW